MSPAAKTVPKTCYLCCPVRGMTKKEAFVILHCPEMLARHSHRNEPCFFTLITVAIEVDST